MIDATGYDETDAMESRVRELELAVHLLYGALLDAANIYGKFGAVVNDPNAPGQWIVRARKALSYGWEVMA